jgi:hypothetical protein
MIFFEEILAYGNEDYDRKFLGVAEYIKLSFVLDSVRHKANAWP